MYIHLFKNNIRIQAVCVTTKYTIDFLSMLVRSVHNGSNELNCPSDLAMGTLNVVALISTRTTF